MANNKKNWSLRRLKARAFWKKRNNPIINAVNFFSFSLVVDIGAVVYNVRNYLYLIRCRCHRLKVNFKATFFFLKFLSILPLPMSRKG